MKPGLQLRTAQTLALTPQLQQAIHFLQLSSLELQQELRQMLIDNPLLEQEGGDEELFEPDVDEPAATTTDSADMDEDFDAAAELPDTFSLLDGDTGGFAEVHEQLDNWSDADSAETAPVDSDEAEELSADAATNSVEDIWGNESAASGDAADAENGNHQSQTLYEYLHQQATTLRLDEAGQAALYYLIESLDEDGYLHSSLAELAQDLQAQQPSHSQSAEDAEEAFSEVLHHLTVALRLLRNFDPPGVGAYDLGECLRLQLKALPIADDETAKLLQREIALDLCQQPLDYLARRDVRGLQKITGLSAAHIQAAMQLIATLEPKPGRRFVMAERNIIVPDILTTCHRNARPEQRWQVALNPVVLPKVRVNEVYAQALRQCQGGDMQQCLQQARWVVKSLQQRFDTILRVAQSIVRRQQAFFEKGPSALQPMILRQVAEELGMHESSISRVSRAKYMATPWGTFELKYFFSSALPTDEGADTASSTAVRALLQQWIAEESPRKPLSDSKLCELLQEQGIQCARRTVAKYRDALRIPPAHLRRSLHPD